MSTGKIRRIDYYPDEYISGVGGVLRADEQGVYWMVCSLIMSEGGPVPFDTRRMAGLCRLRPADIKRIVGTLVDRGKLSLIDGKLSQKRAQSELERAANRIQSASENGAKGGRPKRKPEQNQQNDKAGGSSGEKLTNNQQLATEETPSNEGVERAKPTPRSELERVLDPEHVAAVLEHRKAKGGKFTAYAAKRLASQLEQWPDPNEAADEMIDANWNGFKVPWMERRIADTRGQGPPGGRNNTPTAWQRQAQAFEDLRNERQQHRPDPSLAGPVLSLPRTGTDRQ